MASDWGPFSDTILRFGSTPAVIIDLRREIDHTIRSELRLIGFERTFGIVSAQDPGGVGQPETDNAALAARLQRDVATLGVAQSCVDACSPDGAHRESSVALELDPQALVDLAARYDQLAIFWFDGEAFWIVPVRSRKAKVRLPIPM